MKRIFLIISAIFFLLSSCQDVKRTERPEDLIPEEKMVDIITEVSLLTGARSYNKLTLEQHGLNPREYIWRRFDVDSSQFARSSNFYAENYEQYQRIYDSVKSRLEGMKRTYDSIREEEDRVRDSVRTAVRVRDSLRTLRDSLKLTDSLVPLDSLRNRGYKEILIRSIKLLDSLRDRGDSLILTDSYRSLDSLHNREYSEVLTKSILLLDSLRNRKGDTLILIERFAPRDSIGERDRILPEPMSRERTIP